jgi:hypothetical protein
VIIPIDVIGTMYLSGRHPCGPVPQLTVLGASCVRPSKELPKCVPKLDLEHSEGGALTVVELYRLGVDRRCLVDTIKVVDTAQDSAISASPSIYSGRKVSVSFCSPWMGPT